MKTIYQCWILCLVLACMVAPVAAGNEFPVYPSTQSQELPDVDNGIIVWQQYVEYGGVWDWDIFGVDLFNQAAPAPIAIAWFESNQQKPAVWNNRIVWQDEYAANDWDVYVTDISDANVPQSYLLTLNPAEYENDQINPVIHGNTAVWQHYAVFDDGQGGLIEDWEIYAADITEPNAPYVYRVAEFWENQQNSAIYRNRVVFQDDFYSNWDILSTDVWLKNAPQYHEVIVDETGLNQENPAIWGNRVVWQTDIGGGNYDIYAADISNPEKPRIFPLIQDSAVQTNPDISGHLVVWQDDRHGHWDIYGYNLITKKEFRITADPANQTNPAISGNLVVWEHTPTSGVSNIYAVYLEGTDIADCPNPLAGDIDGDCRVTLSDFMTVAENWLTCNLEPAEVCTN